MYPTRSRIDHETTTDPRPLRPQVSRICVGYMVSGSARKRLRYTINDLQCAPSQFGIDLSCQRRRDRRQKVNPGSSWSYGSLTVIQNDIK